VRALDRATNLPVSVDLENGFGSDPEDAAQAVTRAAEAMATAAERIRDQGDFSGLAAPTRIREWLDGA